MYHHYMLQLTLFVAIATICRKLNTLCCKPTLYVANSTLYVATKKVSYFFKNATIMSQKFQNLTLYVTKYKKLDNQKCVIFVHQLTIITNGTKNLLSHAQGNCLPICDIIKMCQI